MRSGDEARVDHEKARVEAPRPSGRSDRAGEEVDGVERGMHAGRGEPGPGAGGAVFGAPRSETPMTSPVSSKVSRIAASATARAKPGEGRRTRRSSFSSTAGSSAPAAAMRRSSGSTRPPGKTNLPGMNRCEVVALAHQHPRRRAPSDRPRSASPRRAGEERAPASAPATIRRRWVGRWFRRRQVRSPPKPCMPSAHCWPTIAPFMARGK